MAIENVKVLKIETGEAQKSVKDLRQELKSLKDTMLSTEKGTEEYNEALQQAAEIQHTLKEQMEEVNASAMDFGQIAGNCTKAVGGMVAGFQAANAVMNLFGIENEEVLKSLQKMQSLMALTQAFPAIDSGIKAFKRLSIAIKTATGATNGFKAALVSTGIGALVVALGMLIANWDKLTDAMRRWGILGENTQKKIEEQRKKIEELRGEIAKLEGDYDNWLTNNKVEKLNKKAKESYDALAKSIEGYEKELAIAQKQEEERNNRVKGDLGNLEGYYRTPAALKDLIADAKLAQEAILNDADSYKELEKEIDVTIKKQDELAILLWDSAQKLNPQSLQDELNAKFRDNPLTISAKIEIDEDEIEDEEFFVKADELRKNIESIINNLRNTLKTPEEEYAEEQRALEIALNTKVITEEEYHKLSEALTKEYADKQVAITKERVEQQKALAVAETQVWLSALGNIGSVFSSMGDMIDRSTEEGEEKYKALMYTSTVISMLSGIGGAIASAFMPVNAGMTIWGQIAMAASTSASVLASGISQLMQIKNATPNSTLSGMSSIRSSMPNTNAISSIMSPVQYTQDVQGSSIEDAIKDSKVYVTETDISNTQNRVKVTETEARF